MSHTITFNEEMHIIEMKAQGDIFLKEVDEFIVEITQAVHDRNCLLALTDFREARAHLSIIEIFDLPQKIAKATAGLDISVHRMRRAIVVANDLDKFNFFETVAINRNHQLRIFLDIDKARAWLIDK